MQKEDIEPWVEHMYGLRKAYQSFKSCPKRKKEQIEFLKLAVQPAEDRTLISGQRPGGSLEELTEEHIDGATKSIHPRNRKKLESYCEILGKCYPSSDKSLALLYAMEEQQIKDIESKIKRNAFLGNEGRKLMTTIGTINCKLNRLSPEERKEVLIKYDSFKHLLEMQDRLYSALEIKSCNPDAVYHGESLLLDFVFDIIDEKMRYLSSDERKLVCRGREPIAPEYEAHAKFPYRKNKVKKHIAGILF